MSESKYVVIMDKEKSEINYLGLKKRKVSCDVLGQLFDEIEEEKELDKHSEKQSKDKDAKNHHNPHMWRTRE